MPKRACGNICAGDITEFAAEINDKAQELEAKMRLDENYLN